MAQNSTCWQLTSVFQDNNELSPVENIKIFGKNRMEAKTVLLINLNAIILISFCSDHWILLRIRNSPAPPDCSIAAVRQMKFLRCGNSTMALVEQHANLYRQCNDLTDGYRSNVSRAGHLYGTSCHWFIADVGGAWREFESDWGIDMTSLMCALGSLVTNAAAFYQCYNAKPQHVSRVLAASTALFAIPIMISIYVIHSTNTRTTENKAHLMYYAEAGWSLICAFIADILMAMTSYLYLSQHRLIREQQRSQRRRRQMHNAIMSSCRQEIAMAIRARMTVI